MIREKALVEPALRLISAFGDDEGGLDVTRLDELLRKRLTLSDEDREIMKGRKDDRFSQTVRNLVSHRTLERRGFAVYRDTGTYRRGAYYLTAEGLALVAK